ncbi:MULTISPECIES: DUF1064 domain-containing protein [Bacillota]|uniref:DUF1064 domain-containing protein n=1 Tax=Bacillota TaxID=1239 RepID=UPI0028FEE486|nr:DUF1064 domain-containing protein [Veillonella sp.]MDU1127894.1 DUF1064 domain-containing protein [Veillonella sp.]
MSKAGQQKRTYKGIKYDSLTEMQFMKEVIEPKLASGEITKFERQVTYVLQDGFTMKSGEKILPIKYVSDYDVWYSDGTFIVYDIKGQPDSVSLLKRKLFRYRYPDINLVFICRNLKRGGWITYDELKKMKVLEKKSKK